MTDKKTKISRSSSPLVSALFIKLMRVEHNTPEESDFPGTAPFFVSPYDSMLSPKKRRTASKIKPFGCEQFFKRRFLSRQGENRRQCYRIARIFNAALAKICLKKPYGFGSHQLITVACTILFMLNNGVRSNFGLISSAVNERTGLPEDTISSAIAIAQLLYGLSQPFFGMLALKKSNSFVLGVGGVLMSAGLLLIPFSGSAWLLFLSLGLLVGLAAGALAFGVVMGAAAPAIGEKYAAAASGIINGGGGLGGAALALYLQTMTDKNLFSVGMAGLACVSGCVVLLCVWLEKKERSAAPESKADDNAPKICEMLKEAFVSRNFMHLALAFFTCGFFMAIIETYLYPQLVSFGFSGSKVAFFFTIYGVMGMIGPMIAGFLCGKTDPKWVLGTTYALRPILILLFLLLPKNTALVYIFVVGLGLVGNATVPPTTLLITKFFGNRKMPTLSGIAMVFHQIGSAVSTWLGSVFLRSGENYTALWLCGAAFATAAAVLCYTVKGRSEEKQKKF